MIIAAWEFTGLSFTASQKTPIIPTGTFAASLNLTRIPSATPTPTLPLPPSPTAAPVLSAPETPIPVIDNLPFSPGTLLKGSGEGVFRMHPNGTLQHIYDFPTFLAFGFSEADLLIIDDEQLNDLPFNGSELTRLLESPTQDLDWGGERRTLADCSLGKALWPKVAIGV